MIKYIVSIKGFGDALIALWAINHFSDKTEFRLLTTEYIAPLIAHLGKERVTDILPKIINYPEIYNLRNAKFTDVVRSILLLRKEIQHTCNANKYSLIFDKEGLREYLIKPRKIDCKFIANKNEKNIYEGYLRSLSEYGVVSKNNYQFNDKLHTNIAIFFSSRVNIKQINNENLLCLQKCCLDNGIKPIYIRHIKDNFDTKLVKRLNFKTFSNYKELDFILEKIDCVISSDSFPAHYAEYHGKRVYVVNNYPNEYYLPYSTFKNGWWSLGVDQKNLNKFLKKESNDFSI